MPDMKYGDSVRGLVGLLALVLATAAAEIRAQISATERFGSNGWMLWNPQDVYSREGLKED